MIFKNTKTFIEFIDATNNDLNELLILESNGFLFHGSKNELSSLIPFPSHLSDKPVVFAGKLWVALSFIPKWNDNDIEHGTINGIPTIKSKNKNAQDLFNTSGFIYVLPNEKFTQTKEIAGYEFISYAEVPVIKTFKIDNVFNALKRLNVQIT
jgi:hypothetical protein